MPLNSSSLFNYDIINFLALFPKTCARVSLEVEFLEDYEEFLFSIFYLFTYLKMSYKKKKIY